jgi:hypothetical protein
VTDPVCPRCGEAVAGGQEYCLECGIRLPGTERVRLPLERDRVVRQIAMLLVVALAGGAVSIAITWDSSSAGDVIVATGGSSLPQAPAGASSALAVWPPREDGWTVVLASIPKSRGRAGAVARAAEAQQQGLPEVGVLDSSRTPSLHAGYWVVFSGFYETEPEATSDLLRARSISPGATVRRIAGQQR